jgi:hypothetical protein
MRLLPALTDQRVVADGLDWPGGIAVAHDERSSSTPPCTKQPALIHKCASHARLQRFEMIK